MVISDCYYHLVVSFRISFIVDVLCEEFNLRYLSVEMRILCSVKSPFRINAKSSFQRSETAPNIRK